MTTQPKPSGVLTECEVCKGTLASTAITCPHCGALRNGEVVITRKTTLSGYLGSITVKVDGNQIGKLAIGEYLKFVINAGSHTISVHQGGFSDRMEIRVLPGHALRLITHIGLFGPRLNPER